MYMCVYMRTVVVRTECKIYSISYSEGHSVKCFCLFVYFPYMGLHEVRIGGSSEGSKASSEQFPTVAELEVPFALGWNNNARACVCGILLPQWHGHSVVLYSIPLALQHTELHSCGISRTQN